MTTESIRAKTIVEASAKIVTILDPLSPEERHRAVAAAVVVFGQSPGSGSPKGGVHQAPLEDTSPTPAGISPKANGWMKKHSITTEALDHVFSVEADSIEVIAAKMPGNSIRKQTVEAHVICGLKSFLQTGEPNFTNKEARDLCKKVGCYEPSNHHNHIKGLGNLVSGTRDSGWKLTNPGLSRAAEIVKALVPQGS